MAKIFGQLENAQLENKSSDYATGKAGRFWLNTATTLVKFDTGSVLKTLADTDTAQHLANKTLTETTIGTHATAAANVRIYRSAFGKLQVVAGDNATAQGTESTLLNELGHIVERYTVASKPAAEAGNHGRLIFITDLNKFQFNNATPAWQDLLQPTDVAMSALDLDATLGDTFYKSVAANSTLTFSNLQNGMVKNLIIRNTSGANITLTMPAGLYKTADLNLTVEPSKENIYTIIRSNSKTYISYVAGFTNA